MTSYFTAQLWIPVTQRLEELPMPLALHPRWESKGNHSEVRRTTLEGSLLQKQAWKQPGL